MISICDDIGLRWLKPAWGYAWVENNGATRLKPRSSGVTDVSKILAVTPGLFRDFARLNIVGDKIQRSEIREFADGLGDILALPGADHPSVVTWRLAIERMGRAVELWDKIKGSEASDEVHWRSRRALQIEIHRALTDTKTPSHTALRFTPELRFALSPPNLLAYMWLTFARVVSGEIEERPCAMFEICHEYIYVGSGPGLQRDDTTTCSAACRQRKKRREVAEREKQRMG